MELFDIIILHYTFTDLLDYNFTDLLDIALAIFFVNEEHANKACVYLYLYLTRHNRILAF